MNYKLIDTPINEYTFVDLGLPSGNLWAIENTITDLGFRQCISEYLRAINKSSISEYIPLWEDFVELNSHCDYKYDYDRNMFIYYSKTKSSKLELPFLKFGKKTIEGRYIAKDFRALDIGRYGVQIVQSSIWYYGAHYIKLVKRHENLIQG